MSIQGNDGFLDLENASLRVTGNVHAEGLKVGSVRLQSAATLQSTTVSGNTTTQMVQFTNPTKGFDVTSNIEVGDANLYVDTTTGRVGVGTNAPMGTLDVKGVLNHTQVANVAQITSNSNVVMEYRRSKKLIKYPRVAMTQDDESSTTGYVADASTEEAINTGPWKAFNGDGGAWDTTPIRFNKNTGDWDGTTTTPYAISLVGSDTIYGEWVELKIPNKIQLHTCRIAPMTNSTYPNLGKHRSPRDGYILGRVGATGNWTVLKSWSGLISGWEDLVLRDFDIENQLEYYDYFRVVWTAINGNNNY